MVMVGISVCAIDGIALSVLCTVIGHQQDKGWIIVDSGWMALSSDRGTMNQKVDQGYGMVCDISGNPIDDLLVGSTNQEHGIIKRRDGGRADCATFPIGTLLRILPNHACATAAPHERYFVVSGDLEIVSTWPRFNGW